MRRCRICSLEFLPNNGRRQLCFSKECRRENHRLIEARFRRHRAAETFAARAALKKARELAAQEAREARLKKKRELAQERRKLPHIKAREAAQSKRYREKNREAINARIGEKRRANPDYYKAIAQRWFAKARDDLNEKRRLAYKDNWRAVRARAYDWRQQNLERVQEQARRRRRIVTEAVMAAREIGIAPKPPDRRGPRGAFTAAAHQPKIPEVFSALVRLGFVVPVRQVLKGEIDDRS